MSLLTITPVSPKPSFFNLACKVLENLFSLPSSTSAAKSFITGSDCSIGIKPSCLDTSLATRLSIIS